MIFFYVAFIVYVLLMVQIDLMAHEYVFGGMNTITILAIFFFVIISDKIVANYLKIKLCLKNKFSRNRGEKTPYKLLLYKEINCDTKNIDFFASKSFMVENSINLSNECIYTYEYIQSNKLNSIEGLFTGKVENKVCYIYFDSRKKIDFETIIEVLEENNG